mmetsp:Transcript_10582/g.22044  ORF Transcript_10582/g.22044 Transcript_10582/m.22044 type:complete len:233 (-) Transcript_10582:297-995(-)
MPKFISGLSLECLVASLHARLMPLFVHQSAILRSLISVNSGCSFRNQSNQWNVPSPGRKTGKSTSGRPSLGSGYLILETSSSAASLIMRHLNGNSARGSGPKLTCTVKFLNVIIGKSGFPFKISGIGCGLEMRSPSRKSDMVLASGPSSVRFSKTAIATPLTKRCVHCVRLRLNTKLPSESKETLSSASPRSKAAFIVPKPIRSKFRGIGGLTCGCTASSCLGHSQTRTSNM